LIVRYRITSATANRDHSVDIVWSNGKRARVDFKSIIGTGGVLAPLLDETFFSTTMTVAQEGRALEWPGELDFSADSLIYRAFPDLQATDAAQSAAE
jgi:hypothetical protein